MVDQPQDEPSMDGHWELPPVLKWNSLGFRAEAWVLGFGLRVHGCKGFRIEGLSLGFGFRVEGLPWGP